MSRAAVAELTRKQTPAHVKEGYGLGWLTSGRSFGHGGAYSTGMTIDRDRGLIYSNSRPAVFALKTRLF